MNPVPARKPVPTLVSNAAPSPADKPGASDWPFFDLQNFELSAAVAQLLPESLARRLQALVLEEQGRAVLVGMTTPGNLRAQDEISLALRRPIDVVRIDAQHWLETVDRLYGKSEQIDVFARAVLKDVDRGEEVVDLDSMGASVDANEAPVVRLLQTIFDHATQTRASDIHIEPQEGALRVRFRVDGALHVELDASLKIAAALTVRLKLMAGLDIAERRLPQDGRFALRTQRHALDVRMSTLPTLYGESIVLRILMQRQGVIGLDESGMAPALLARFNRAIKAPHGIVLVTGPTGSGKTTTLYGALQTLNVPDVKILTCEDPVEYRLPGINQVQINDKIGLSFARVLRAFLRQDPDIIFVGEIRDEETAQIATRAAMTGHLVLSTLHTNDAASTPRRLMDMGVPGYLVASTLLCVLSQRLVRRVCRHCSAPHVPDMEEQRWLRQLIGQGAVTLNLRRGLGCSRCNGSGYLGRVGVFELLELDPELVAALHAGDAGTFEALAVEHIGRNGLAHSVLARVLAGETTVAEGMKVLLAADG